MSWSQAAQRPKHPWALFLISMIPRIKSGAKPDQILEHLSKNWDEISEASPHGLRRWASELSEFKGEWPSYYEKGFYIMPDGRRVQERVWSGHEPAQQEIRT